jgi:GxxExxY protein
MTLSNKGEVILHDEDLTKEIIGAAIEVHRRLGPGLLESAYRVCLCHELSLRQIPFVYECPLSVEYKGVKLDCGYRIDIKVDDRVIIELKSVGEVTSLHRAQLLTYLRLTGKKIGLILNFNSPVLKDGIVRMAL